MVSENVTITREDFYHEGSLHISNNVCRTPATIPDSLVDQVGSAVNQWCQHVDLERETYVAKNYGIPSFLVRVDCTVDTNGMLRVFEIEEPPAGASMTSRISPQFASLLASAQERWPKFKAFVSPKKRFSDVALWLGRADVDYSGLLWCVIRPEEADEFSHLIPRSVTPIRKEGDKTPLSKVFNETKVGSVDDLLGQVSLEHRIVFKPAQGTRAHGVTVWWPDAGKPKDAINQEERLRRVLESKGINCWIAQPFYSPRPVNELHPSLEEYAKYWYIYRIYCAYSLRSEAYYPIGGVSNWLNSKAYSIVHGRDSAVFSPAILTESRAEQISSSF